MRRAGRGRGRHRPRGAWSVLAVLGLVAGCTSQPPATAPQQSTTSARTPATSSSATDTRTPATGRGSISSPTPVTSPSDVSSGSSSPAVTGSAPGTVGGGPPAVVRLQWLGPDPQPDGPHVDLGDGEVRWQSRTPGEYAVRTATDRRWFGADGSAVICRGERTCIGFDSSGTVAVTGDSSVRSVYDPTGAPLGWFLPDGRRRDTGAQPAFAQAVAGTGLDLAALVQESGLRVPFAGGITGDPHLITGGGRRVSIQYGGDFEARSGDPERLLQMRWSRLPHQPNVTIVTSFAVATGGTVVRVDSDGRVLIGGVPVQDRTEFQQIRIDGPVVGVWPIAADGSASAAVVWSDGSALSIRTDPALGETVVLTAPRSSTVRGVFGTGDATSTDLVDREGIALDSASVLTDWTVPIGQELIDDRPTPSISYPSDIAQVPEEADSFAARTCRAQGVAEGADLAACSFDVALTGDTRFAVGHGLLVAAATTTVPSRLADRWPAMRDRAPLSAVQLPSRVDLEPAPGEQLAYSVPVGSSGALSLRFDAACSGDDELSVDRPALRLFDASGRPVSERFAACGEQAVDELPPGRYRLVVAGPTSGTERPVRFTADSE